MRIVLSGGEKGTYRNVLTANDVSAIALNITQFAVPKTKEVHLKELLGGAEVYVYTSDDDEDIAKFDDFIRTHVDDITMVIGRPDYNGTWLGAKYVPLWNDPNDLERLAHLCQKNGRVAISDRAITPKTVKRIRDLQKMYGVMMVGLTSKVDNIEALPWDVVIVSSWTSVVRYGETQVWDGRGLRRYPSQKKESSRKRHRPDILRLGVDYDAILEDDVKEVAKLAVRSWQAWEEHTYGAPTPAAYHPSDDSDEEEFDSNTEGDDSNYESRDVGHSNSLSNLPTIATDAPRERAKNERQLLPVMGFEQVVSVGTRTGENADETYEINPQQETVLRVNSKSLRICDSCYLAGKCPRFEEHAECAYELPVEVKTKEQLQAVLRAMLEMQTSRILFARFAEELEGQGIDPGLSKEIDRLFELTEKFKNIQDTRDLVRFEVEARAGAGVLSRIFGDKAGARLQEIQSQQQPALSTGQIDSIIDAEVLDPN